MQENKPKKMKKQPVTLSMKEPELFARMSKIFAARKLSGIAISLQARLALGEWCDLQEKSE